MTKFPYDVIEVAGFKVLTGDPVVKAAMARLAELDAQCRRLQTQLDSAPQDFSKPPDPALAGKIPVVVYFANQEEANGFISLARLAMENPVEIRLPLHG